MKNKPVKKGNSQKHTATAPVKKYEDIQSNPDNHIDQDFPGFPHSPSKEDMINPKTPQQKKTAGVVHSDSKT